MRNLKKLLAVIVAICVLASFTVPAFAAETTAPATTDAAKTPATTDAAKTPAAADAAKTATTPTISADAQACKDLGVVVGDGKTSIEEYVKATPTRLQTAVMLLRLKGLEAEAKAFKGKDNFKDVKDVTWGDGKAILAYLKSKPELGFAGGTDGKFSPNEKTTVQQYYKVLLTVLGYKAGTETGADFKWEETIQFAAGKGLTKVATVTNFTIGDLATATIEALKAEVKGTKKTLAATLVDAKVISAEAAAKANLVVSAKGLKVSSAVSINSKIVEVSLNSAATSADMAPGAFVVKDEAGKAYNVTKAELAPYNTDNKTVLLTFENDLTAGALYSMTVGDKVVNFGGRGKDTTKPEIKSNGLEATDANEVTISLTEPIKLEGVVVKITENISTNGTKAELPVTNIKYDGNDKLVLSVGDMKESMLYKAEVSGIKDFAGNEIDKDDKKTFASKPKPTDALKVEGIARANDCEEIVVKFNVNVDPSTLIPANFSIYEDTSAKTAVVIKSVRLAKKDDIGTDSNKLNSSDAKRSAIIIVDPTMKQTLYKLQFSNLKTLYGVAQSTTDSERTASLSGEKKPTDALELKTKSINGSSNTTFTITFEQKVDKTLAETLANYTIEDTISKAALTIKSAVLQDNNKDVKFTVASMKGTLYKLTVNNVKDIWGNSIKTSDSGNTVSIAGRDVATKIESISSISRIVPSNYTGSYDSDTQIFVTFNENVGSNAEDVSLYNIDNNVGYPAKAQTVDGAGNENKVLLTIGKTNIGTSYKLTVKRLLNADGVAMGSDGVSYTFAGQGNSYSLPRIQGTFTVDKQTLNIAFDRKVDGSDFVGKIWNDSSSAHTLYNNIIKYKASGSSSAAVSLSTLPHKVWKSPDNENVLVLRVDEYATNGLAPFSSSSSSNNMFTVEVNPDYIDKDNSYLGFTAKKEDVSLPELQNGMGESKRTVLLYFSQPVDLNTSVFADSFIRINKKENMSDPSTEVKVAASKAMKVNDRTYRIITDSELENTVYYVRITDLAKVTDKSGFYKLKAKDSSSSYASAQFSGTSSNFVTTITENDVNGIMTSKKALKFYFPEDMYVANSSAADYSKSVTNPNNYRVYKNNATTASDIAGGDSIPKAVLYDKDSRTATLYFPNEFTGGSSNTYYLGISSTVASATLLKNVKNDKTILFGTANTSGTGVLRPFAKVTGDDAKPVIKGVEVSTDNTTVTIEMDQKVAAGVNSAAGINVVDNGTISGASDIAVVDAAEKAFSIVADDYFKIKDGNTNKDLSIVSSKKISNTKFEYKVATPLSLLVPYEVRVAGANAWILNIAGTSVETASDKVSKFPFTVGGTARADTTPPAPTVATQTVVSGSTVSVTSNEAGTVYMVNSKLTTGIGTVTALDALVTAGTATKAAIATANTAVNITVPTPTTYPGTYAAIAVDAAGNVSEKSTNIVTVTPASTGVTAGSPTRPVVGKAQEAGTPQVETATVLLGTAANGTINVTVSGLDLVNSPFSKAIPVTLTTADTTANAIAAKVITALTNDSYLPGLFIVSGNGANIVLTKKVAAANDTTLNIALVNDGAGTSITDAPTSANTTAGKTAVAAVAEVNNVTIINGATATGNITVTVDGTAVTVAVVKDESAVAVAGKIVTELNKNTTITTKYAVTNPANTATVVLTNNTAGAVTTPLAFTVAG